MVGTISCFVVGCNNPIIGQCSGYNGGCGRFYCHEHSLGKYCNECGSRKANDDQQKAEQEEAERIYQDFLQTAEMINEPTSSRTWGIVFAIVGVAFLIFTQQQTGMPFTCGFPSILISIILFMYYTSHNKKAKLALAKYEASKPGFGEFYKNYKAFKKQEARMENWKMVGELGKATIQGVAEGGKVAGKAIIDDVKRH